MYYNVFDKDARLDEETCGEEGFEFAENLKEGDEDEGRRKGPHCV